MISKRGVRFLLFTVRSPLHKRGTGADDRSMPRGVAGQREAVDDRVVGGAVGADRYDCCATKTR
jgi:hypothetical protein